MIAGGIDLGGTKIEASVFDADWQPLKTRRVATPPNYEALLLAMQDQVAWLNAQAENLPIGIGIPGLHDKARGVEITANLAANQKPFRADIHEAIARPVSFGNDCDLFAFSETLLGAGKGFNNVFGLVLGTGIGGGFCLNQTLLHSRNGAIGEVGHLPIPAALAQTLDLPLLRCGCGRIGCFETLASGPGMVALGQSLTGRTQTPAEIAAENGPVFAAWLQIIAALVASLQCTLDPDCIVLGGGLSNISGVAEKISTASAPILFSGTLPPDILVAKYGDSSGTRGAALLGFQEAKT